LNNLSAIDLSEYNQWANRTLIEALEKIPTQELTRPRVSLFRDICHTLNHMLVIGRIWRGHLEGQDHGYTARNTPSYPTFPDLAKQLADIDDWYVAWARQRQLGDLISLCQWRTWSYDRRADTPTRGHAQQLSPWLHWRLHVPGRGVSCPANGLQRLLHRP
jgi:uncharacterized damage-inducible protein DinB